MIIYSFVEARCVSVIHCKVLSSWMFRMSCIWLLLYYKDRRLIGPLSTLSLLSDGSAMLWSSIFAATRNMAQLSSAAVHVAVRMASCSCCIHIIAQSSVNDDHETSLSFCSGHWQPRNFTITRSYFSTSDLPVTFGTVQIFFNDWLTYGIYYR